MRNNQIINLGYILECKNDNIDKINTINIKMNYLEEKNIKVNNNYEINENEKKKLSLKY